MSLIHRIFGNSDAALICPHCERALVGHDAAACARRMSRRWFIGAMAGAAASLVVASPPKLYGGYIWENGEFNQCKVTADARLLSGSGIYRMPRKLSPGGAYGSYPSHPHHLLYEIIESGVPIEGAELIGISESREVSEAYYLKRGVQR